MSHDGFTIQPDTFSVIRVQGSMQQVVQRRPVQLAALRLAGGFDGGMGAEPTTRDTISGWNLTGSRR